MGKAKWVGRDLYNLLNKPIKELEIIYPQYNKSTLKGKQAYWKKKLNQGEVAMPNPEQEGFISQTAELLERSGITGENIEGIDRITSMGSHVGYIKNADGEIEYTEPLPSVKYIPKAEVDEMRFINQAKPTIIKPIKKPKTTPSDRETAFIWPDSQIWYRDLDGELDPLHDEDAINVGLQLIRDIQPDQIVFLGDNLDFPQLGRWEQEKALQDTWQPSMDRFHQLMAEARANAPDAKIVVLEGNHELRLRKYIAKFAMHLYGLRRSGEVDGDSVLSLPNLLNLDKIGNTEYISSYPAGEYWLNDGIKAIHGNVTRPAGKTAAAIVGREQTSTLFGHVHRHEAAMRTLADRKTAKIIGAWAFGCVAKIDGTVPGYGTGTDESGRPAHRVQNWQQGYGVVEYDPKGDAHSVEPVYIDTFDGHRTNYRGRVYTPQKDE